MMDFLELCRTRQSCRDFSDKPVEHEKLVKCIEAARLAPSGCNAQPWSFIVVESPEKMAEVVPHVAKPGMNEYFAKAKAFIVILEEHATLMPGISPLIDSQYFAKGDLGTAASYICLAAASQGLGSCVVGIYDREKLRPILDIPVDKHFGWMIALGYPADDQIRPKARKSIERIAKFL